MKTATVIFTIACWLVCGPVCFGQVPDTTLCGEVGQPWWVSSFCYFFAFYLPHDLADHIALLLLRNSCGNLELCNVMADPLHVCVKNTCTVFQDELCGLPGGPCSPDFYTNVSFTQLGRFTPNCVAGSGQAGRLGPLPQYCPSDRLCEYNPELNRFWPTCQPLPKACGSVGEVCCPSPTNSSANASLACSGNASYCIAFPSSPFYRNGHHYQRSKCVEKKECGSLGEACCPPRGLLFTCLLVCFR